MRSVLLAALLAAGAAHAQPALAGGPEPLPIAPAAAAAGPDESPGAGALDASVALRTAEAAIGRAVGDHVLLDRQGRPVPLARYRGKPLLVSFIYTGCFQVCPATTRLLLEAVRALGPGVGADRFEIVSIGFNPPADSPAAMRAFAAQHRIDAPNWNFLSPPAAGVDALTRDFGFSYVATPAGFDHLLAVTVVDAQGRIRAQIYDDRLSAEGIGEPLRLLLRDSPLPLRPSLAELVERVRVLCTVYDPATGRYRLDWGLILEVAGGLTFIVAMTAFFVGEWRARRRPTATVPR
jgi:protein SCO1/2